MNETPATVRMIDGATAPAISNVFVNNACAVCTLQITGSFTAATVLVEGIVNVASNQWVTLAVFNLSDLSLEKDGADKAGIYQVGIEGILRVRMNVTEISGGDITIAAQFGNATINQFSKTEASNLIPITAYDLAVAGGYTGTLEQFETDMGNSGTNATAAAESASSAAQTLSDVQTAGAEAVDAVQTKGQEVLASIPEDYTELTGEVSNLKESIDDVTAQTIGKKYLDKNLSDIRNAYLRNTAIGDTVVFNSSTVTKSIVNFVSVESGKKYAIYVTQSDSPATTTTRSCAIVDENNIIQQNIFHENIAGTVSEIKFTAAIDGNVIVCVDANYTNIEAVELVDYNLFSDYPTDVESLLPTDEWFVGSIAGGNGFYSGMISNATIRLVPSRKLSYPQYKKCYTINNYAFNVAAYDAMGDYIGKYDTSNQFSKTGAVQKLSEFDFSVYPDYTFLLALMREDDTEDISIDESANCIFVTDYLELTDSISNIVGYNARQILANGESVPNKTIFVPVDIKKGDSLEMFIEIPDREAVTIVTAKDGVNIDTFIYYAKNGIESIIKAISKSIIATADANCLKIYAQSALKIKYRIWKNINGNNTKGIAEDVSTLSADVQNHKNQLDIISDSNALALNGEMAIKIESERIDDKKLKIVMLDNNYKYFTISNIKAIIDAMSQSGCNALMLGFGGSGRGLSFKLDNMTILSYGVEYDLADCISTDFGNYYNETDMNEIITYANTNGIEIIPSFNMPGHFAPFLVKNVQFRYRGDADSININDPKARDYAYKISEMYIKWFSERGIVRWHFGADEFNYESGANPYYNLYRAGNFNYALFINEIAYIVSKYRMIPYAWNDAYGIGGTVNPMLNRNVPVLYWKKQSVAGVTASAISALGNPMINSSVNIYWVANGQKVTEQQMRAFNVKNYPDGSVINDTVGACFCIWIGKRESPALNDGGDAITSQVLPLIRAFGETVTPQFV